MKIIKIFVLAISFFAAISVSYAQMGAFSDPVMAYNKMLLDKGSNATYRRVGAFNVTGSPYIYSENLRGDIYYNKSIVKNAAFRINNYDNTIEIETTVPGQYFIVSSKDLDSFHIASDSLSNITVNATYYSASKIDANNNSFLLNLYDDSYFRVFKSYKTNIDIPSDNYIQTDLRVFSLSTEYYYTTKSAPNKLILLKSSKSGLIKEFKNSNARVILNDIDFTKNKDVAISTFFSKLALDLN